MTNRCETADQTDPLDGIMLCFLLILALCTRVYSANARHRTCWWNEVCKEEFHSKFRCRCPKWSYCRSPGRYYDAHCSMTRTGYIWTQPETSLSLEIDK
ncbi:hypothetical protein ALC57_01615 [Trachymyrmex cornetzi]|uniref:Uncharacterized protein n=1 Tax=Trachymyrmex cornetzi TaxID=471704 RepID=A0A195EL66_9HYME|nr:hypothetical protein ALC57_01615 [Trachymyrmex cornetzi]